MKLKTTIKYAGTAFILPAFISGLSWLTATEAAELNGFAINTQDKAVTVTLYADHPLEYKTEKQDRQFTIILPEAQLSKRQMDEGLPVVLDNQNRFLGRAVPTSDGRVKIILPNLPTDEYSVSVHQQSGNKTAQAGTTGPTVLKPSLNETTETPHTTQAVQTVKPRPPILVKGANSPGTNKTSPFDQLVSSKAATAGLERVVEDSGRNAMLPPNKLAVKPNAISLRSSRPYNLLSSAEEAKNATAEKPTGNPTTLPGTIWNPYVVKNIPSTTKPNADTPDETLVPVYGGGKSDDDYSQSIRLYTAPAGAAARMAAEANDPLAQLHELAAQNQYTLPVPPSFPFPLPKPNVAGVTGNIDPSAPAKSEANSKKADTISPNVRPTIIQTRTELPFMPPKWVWATLSVFFASVGIFCIVGTILLIRLLLLRNSPLKNQALQAAESSPKSLSSESNVVNLNTPPVTSGRLRPELGKKLDQATANFKDDAIVNALDYMSIPSPSMTRAVRVTSMSHFSSRTGKNRPAMRTRM